MGKPVCMLRRAGGGDDANSQREQRLRAEHADGNKSTVRSSS